MLLLLWCASTVLAADFNALCVDRAAIERVYHSHRTGEKPAFEQALPRATLEQLVRMDLKKESVLQKVYRITITPALLDGEVQRINSTTRAPETLAEIKAALGSDPKRFAESFAKPFLVERLLREKFENDDTLHASVRRECEQARNTLLTARPQGMDAAQLIAKLKDINSNAVTEVTWQLQRGAADSSAAIPEEAEIKRRFGTNAQILSSRGAPNTERTLYFDDLPAPLKNVLRVQLQKANDVSAVIETPGGFLLYVARERSDARLSAAILSLPKRSYEEWLASQ